MYCQFQHQYSIMKSEDDFVTQYLRHLDGIFPLKGSFFSGDKVA